MPEKIIEKVILKRLTTLLQKKEKFILDGFPKTLEQAQYLDNLLTKYSLNKTTRFIYLDVSLKVALKRIQGRKTCSSCGKLYNVTIAKPKLPNRCDKCHLPLFKRFCDNKENFEKRIYLFNQTVKKILSFYESQGKLININTETSLDLFKEQVLRFDENAPYSQ